MRKMLKILNPFIYVWNLFKHQGHLELYRYGAKYKAYDFEKNDTKYF